MLIALFMYIKHEDIKNTIFIFLTLYEYYLKNMFTLMYFYIIFFSIFIYAPN